MDNQNQTTEKLRPSLLPTTTEIFNKISENNSINLENNITYLPNGVIKVVYNKEINSEFKRFLTSDYFLEYRKNKVKLNLSDSFLLEHLTKIEEVFDVVSDAGRINLDLKNFFYKPHKENLDGFAIVTKSGIFKNNIERLFENENLENKESFLLDTEFGVLKTSFDYHFQKDGKEHFIYTKINETRKLDSLDAKIKGYMRQAAFDNYVIGQQNDFESTLLLGALDKEYLSQFAKLSTLEDLNSEKTARENIINILKLAIDKKTKNKSLTEILGFKSDLIYNEFENLTLKDLKLELSLQEDDLKTLTNRILTNDYGIELPRFKIKGKDGLIYIKPDNDSALKIFPSIKGFDEPINLSNELEQIHNIITDKLPNLIKYEKEMNLINPQIRHEMINLLLFLNKHKITFEEIDFIQEEQPESETINIKEIISKILSKDEEELDEELKKDINTNVDKDKIIHLNNLYFQKRGTKYNIELSKFIQEKLLNTMKLIIEKNKITMELGVSKRTDHTFEKSILKELKNGLKWFHGTIKDYVDKSIDIILHHKNVNTDLKTEETKMAKDFKLSSVQLKNIFNTKFESILEKFNDNILLPKDLLNIKDLKNLMSNEINIDQTKPCPNGAKRWIVWDTETTGLFNEKVLLAYDKDGKFITEWEGCGVDTNNAGLVVYGYDKSGNEILYRNKKEYDYLFTKDLVPLIPNDYLITTSGNIIFVDPKKIIDEVIHFAAIVVDIDKEGKIVQKQGVSQQFGTNLHITKFIENLVHINNNDVKDKELFIKSQDKVLDFFKTGDVITGYNIGSKNKEGFDKRITEYSFNNFFINDLSITDDKKNSPDIQIYDYKQDNVIDGIELFRNINTYNLTKYAQNITQTSQTTKGQGTLDNSAQVINDCGRLERSYHHPLIDALMSYNTVAIYLNMIEDIYKAKDLKNYANLLIDFVHNSHLINRDKYPIAKMEDVVIAVKKDLSKFIPIDKLDKLDTKHVLFLSGHIHQLKFVDIEKINNDQSLDNLKSILYPNQQEKLASRKNNQEKTI